MPETQSDRFCLSPTVTLQVGIAFVDKDYPARAAFGIVTRVLDEYSDQSRDAWRTATADTNDAVPMLEAAVSKYQARLWHTPLLCPHASCRYMT